MSIYLAIFSDRLTTYLPQAVTSAVESAGLPASSLPELFVAMSNGTTAALESVHGMNESILEAFAVGTKHAYAHAFEIVYLATLSFTGVGLFAAFFIKDVNDYLTDYVNKTIHKPKLGKKSQAEV